MKLYKLWNLNKIFKNNATNKSTYNYDCIFTDWHLIDWMDFSFHVLLPFILMISFTCLTVKFIIQSRRNISRKTKTNEKRIAGALQTTDQVLQTIVYKFGSTINPKDLQFAINSISLNLCFLLFTSPHTFYSIITDYVNMETDTLFSIAYITLMFYVMNFGMSFYLSIKVNSLFRNEFFRILEKLKASAWTSNQNHTSPTQAIINI